MVALLAVPGPASVHASTASRFKTGTYVGDSSANRSITGLGFSPDFVIIKANNAAPAVARSSTMSGSKELANSTPLIAGYIKTLDADGFTVGSAFPVNTWGVSYYWMAFDAVPGEVAVGTYVGNGAMDRSVSGLGFPPSYVIVMNPGNRPAVQRFPAQTDDGSFRFNSSQELSDLITAFEPDGFRVHDLSPVNESGVTHHYVAWKLSFGYLTGGSYTGNGADDRPIPGGGFQLQGILLKSEESPRAALLRPASLSGDATLRFDANPVASNEIQAILTDGFQVGSANTVNESSRTHHWVGFGNGTVTTPLEVSDLAVTKIADRVVASEGDTITYSMTVANSGPDPATGLTLADLLPAGLTYDSHSVSAGSYLPGTGVWTVGGLAQGASATFTLRAIVNPGTAGTSIANTLSVTALDQSDPISLNNSATAKVLIAQTAYQMVTGQYTGDGTPARGISGLGFEPDLVLIKGNLGQEGVARTKTMIGNGSKLLGSNTALTANLVKSINGDGFTVGSNGAVNQAGTVYSWQAFKRFPGEMAIGSYVGNGADNRSITGIGFKPGVVFVFAEDGEQSMLRFDSMPGDASIEFREGNPRSDRIQALELDGFQVGRHNTVNKSGITFHYVAWKGVPGRTTSGSFTGNGIDDRNITGAGFEPDYMVVAHGSSTKPLAQRSDQESGDLSFPFTNLAGTANVIQQFHADGFQVGTADNVNESGKPFYWAAFSGPASADLSVIKSVDNAAPAEGDTVTFTVVAGNSGPGAIAASVNDPVPAGLTFVSASATAGSYAPGTGTWTIGNLGVGAAPTLTLRARVNAGSAGLKIANTAVITSSGGDPNPANNTATASLTVASVDLALTKDVDLSTVNVGDTLTFTVGIVNNGPQGASSITVTDAVPAYLTYVSHSVSQGSYASGGGSWLVGSLTAGSTATLTLRAQVNADAGGRSITNTASLLSSIPVDNLAANNSAGATVLITSVDLAISKALSNGSPNEGDTLTYTVVLPNLGPDDASGITVVDQLPAGVTYVDHTVSSGAWSPGTGAWTINSLSSGASDTLSIRVTVDTGTAGSTITNTARITAAAQSDPDTTNNASSAAFGTQSADLRVTKTASAGTVNEGSPVVFTIRLVNAGPDTATGVVLKDKLPGGLAYSGHSASVGSYVSGTGTWTLGTVTPGDSAFLTLNAVVASGTGGTMITNTASVYAAAQSDPVGGNNVSAAAVRVLLSDLSAAKAANRSRAAEGDTVTFTVTVTNEGPDPATSVSAVDSLPPGFTYVSHSASAGTWTPAGGLWSIGTLGTNASAVLTLAARVNAGTAGSSLTNRVAIQAGDQADHDAADNTAAAVVAIPSVNLGLVKTVNTAVPTELDTLVYTLTLTNEGPDNATGARVTDVLPAGLSFVSAAPSQGTWSSGSGLWTVGGLANGASAVLTLRARVNSGTGGTTITNTGTISDLSETDPVPGNNSSSVSVVVQTADLFVMKSVNALTPNVGDTLTFTVTAGNQGPHPATQAVVLDLLPAGLTFVSATPAVGSYSSTSGIWTIGSLASSASVQMTLRARVGAGTGGSTITNDASVTARQKDPDTGNNSASATVTVRLADLGLAKSVNVAEADEGDTLTWTITLSNAGPDTATNVTVTDLLPAGLTFVSSAPTPGTYASGTGLWTVGTLAAGGSGSLILKSRVAGGTGGSILTNSASVSTARQADPVPGNNTASAGVTIRTTDLSMAKTVDRATPSEGDTLVYTVTLSNVGTGQATGVVVSDLLPGGLAIVSSSPAQGSYNPTTGAWTVGTLAAGSSRTLTLTARTLSGTGGTTIVNTAAVASLDQTDPIPGNNSASAAVTVFRGFTVSASQAAQALLPGGTAVEMYRLRLVNGTAAPETLTTVTLAAPVAGPGTGVQKDGEWATLVLRAGSAPAILGTSTVSGGQAVFTGLSLTIGSTDSLDLRISGGATLVARDGDVLDMAVVSSSSLVFKRPVAVQAAWPLDPADSFPVDGMARAQVVVHPVPSSTALAGAAMVPVLDVTIPANGYDADLLEQVRLTNAGTAEAGTDIDSLSLWIDGGNASFDGGAGDDTRLGVLSWSGSDWILGGLSRAIPAAGLRTFVAAGIAPLARNGRTIQLRVPSAPQDGFRVASANDGPRDAEVLAAGVVTIVDDPAAVISLSAGPQGSSTLLPGGPAVELLNLLMENSTARAETLEAVTVRNATVGTGTAAQLDASLSSLSLVTAVAAAGTAPLGSGAVFTPSIAGGDLLFSGLSVVIPANSAVALSVRGAASLAAADGDLVDLSVSSPDKFVFSRPVPVVGSWPLNPAGGFMVDGMAAAQLQVVLHPDSTAFPGEARRLGLEVVVPLNGYRADVIESIRVTNLGTALAVTDIDSLELWVDGGNGTFDAGALDDARAAGFTWTGSVWSAPSLSVPVSTGGARLFVSTTIAPGAVPGRTVRLSLPASPTEGVTVASGNDGPRDAAVSSPATLTVNAPASGLVNVVADPQESRTLLPGGPGVNVLTLRMTNPGTQTEILSALRLTNATSGPGSASDLDAEWAFESMSVTGNAAVIPLSATFENGLVTLSDLGIALPPGQTVVVSVIAGATLKARDGDRLDLRILSASDFTFSRTVTVGGAFPLSPAGYFTVDGMAADQVTLIPVKATTYSAGESRRVAFHATLPANGYEADVLNRFNLMNLGTAGPTDLSRLELWADTGNGTFEAASDRYLGAFQHTGDRWEITGLRETIPRAGREIFVTLNVSELAVEGRTVRFAIPGPPDLGVGMASGNDGPLDRSVDNPHLSTITVKDRVTLTAVPVPSTSVAPGEKNVRLLQFSAVNTYTTSRRLTELVVRNRSQGPGSQSELDGEIDVLFLHSDGNGNGIFDGKTVDPLLGTAAFNAGEASFTGLTWDIVPGGSRTLFVLGEVSRRRASDGDILAIDVADPFSTDFSEPTSVAAVWPLDSGARPVIDGMVRAQVGINPVDALTLGPGAGPVPALDIVIPPNGYQDDVLNGLRIVNNGSAGSSDIAEFRLWRDGGDGRFDGGAADDQDLGVMTFVSGSWQSPILSEPIPVHGARLFVSMVTAASTADSVTVRPAVPVNGIVVASGNDGPRDAAVVSPLGLLISSSPLLSTLRIEPGASTPGLAVAIRMTVQNASAERISGVVPSPLTMSGTGVLTPAGGPVPAILDLDPGAQGVFSWTFTAFEPGEVLAEAFATGTGDVSGAVQSYRTSSNEHYIYQGADNLELFSTRSSPFTANLGQTGVVPFSFTFRNPGDVNASDIQVSSLRIRVENEAGLGIVPSALLSRVVISEGNRVYLTRDAGSLESSGEMIDLTLAVPVIVTRLEPVTLNMLVDLKSDTDVPAFRLVLSDSTMVSARDVTSGAPVSVTLMDLSYPIRSGLGRVVAEATELNVSGGSDDRIRVSPGQAGVPLFRFDLENPGIDGITSDIRVGSFSLGFADSTGAPHGAPQDHVDRFWIMNGARTLLTRSVDGPGGPDPLLVVSPSLGVPVNAPLPLIAYGDIPENALPGEIRMRLGDPARFDARDANSRDRVPALYSTQTILGTRILVEKKAQRLEVAGRPALPEVLPVGSRGVDALTGLFTHPGDQRTARIRVSGLSIECRNEALALVEPGRYLSRIAVYWNDMEVAVLTGLAETRTAIPVALPDLLVNPGETVMLRLVLDVSASAPAGRLQLLAAATGITAVDANSGRPVSIDQGVSAGPVLFSGLTRLEPPARELRVGFAGRLPAALVADGSEITAAELTLANTAAGGSGDIRLTSLAFRAADARGSRLPMSAVAAVEVYRGTEKHAAQAVREDSLLTLVFRDTLSIEPEDTAPLEIRVSFRPGQLPESFRLGLDAADFGLIQPAGALLAVEVRPAAGLAFPLWTEAGRFEALDLEKSYANFPNPFAAGREATTFLFFLPKPGRVSIDIWTPRGEKVVALVGGDLRFAGLHQADRWNGRNGNGDTVRNGVYLAELNVTFEDGTTARFFRKVAVVR